jgi:hypothetical protein
MGRVVSFIRSKMFFSAAPLGAPLATASHLRRYSKACLLGLLLGAGALEPARTRIPVLLAGRLRRHIVAKRCHCVRNKAGAHREMWHGRPSCESTWRSRRLWCCWVIALMGSSLDLGHPLYCIGNGVQHLETTGCSG